MALRSKTAAQWQSLFIKAASRHWVPSAITSILKATAFAKYLLLFKVSAFELRPIAHLNTSGTKPLGLFEPNASTRLSSAVAHQSNIVLRELFQTHFVESNAGLFEHAASSSAALPLLGIDKAVAIAVESLE